jgi:hypothetical protein
MGTFSAPIFRSAFQFAIALPAVQAGQPVYPIPHTPSVWEHMSTALHDSIYRVLSLLISLLPGLLALVLAIGVLTAVGALAAWALRRILTSIKFDERLARNRTARPCLSRAPPSGSASCWDS